MIVVVIIGILSVSAFGAYTTQQRRETQRTTLLYTESFLKRARNSAISSLSYYTGTENELVSYGVHFKKSESIANAGIVTLFSDTDHDGYFDSANDEVIDSYPLKSGLIVSEITGDLPTSDLEEGIVLYIPPRGEAEVKENDPVSPTTITELNIKITSEIASNIIKIYGATGVVDITKE